MTVELIGYLAAILTTISFVPQAVKVVRTRDTAALSLHMYLLFTTGVWLWTIYGFFLGNIPLIAANSITALLSTLILTMKLREPKL